MWNVSASATMTFRGCNLHRLSCSAGAQLPDEALNTFLCHVESPLFVSEEPALLPKGRTHLAPYGALLALLTL